MIILRNKRVKFSFLCLIIIGFTFIMICLKPRNDYKGITDYTDRNNTYGSRETVASTNSQDGIVHKQPAGQDRWYKEMERVDGISDDGINHVLLNSYMRSGSSFMGWVLGNRDDTFYYFEPLNTGNVWNYHKGMDEMCHTTTPKCWKKPGELNVSRSILKNVFSCHLRDIGSKLTESFHTAVGLGGKITWEQYQTCKNTGHDKQYCLKKMEEYCQSRTTRVTKVLRLDLNLAEVIFHDIPRLKIVHLFRDPRGTMSSHVSTKWFPTTTTDTAVITTDAQVYCERVKVDILAAIAFHEMYPDRLRGIQYEDFYNLKEKSKLLYDYLGMNSSEKYLNFVLSQFSQETKYNATQIDKSKLFAYREELPWKVVQIVEKQCADVINLLGLKLYGNEENYKDQNFSSINGQLRFGLSQV